MNFGKLGVWAVVNTLAAARTDGVLTYNGMPAHTTQTREILGPKAVLCVEQMVVLESDPAIARV